MSSKFNKQEFLQEIVKKINSKDITLSDINSALLKVKSGQTPRTGKESTFIKTLSMFGSALTITGFLFLISVIWSGIGDFTQVLLTLILGLLLYVLGFVLMGKKNIARQISLPVNFAAMVLIPIGIFVFLNKLPDPNLPESLVAFLVFLFLALFYLFTDYKLKNNLFTIACYVFFSLSYYCLSVLFFDTIQVNTFRITALSYMLYSIPLIFLPVFLKSGFRNTTLNFFQGFGYFNFFISIFILTFDSVFEPINLLIYILAIFISDKFNSVSLKVFSFVAIFMYIIYANTRYFVNVIGWPISLIFSGLTFVFLPYIYIKFKTKSKKLN